MMCLVGGFTEVNRRQKGENERLQKRHEEFQAVHENHERRGEDADAVARGECLTTLAEDEHQAHEGQNDDVASADVCGQTNHQDDRLEEHPHNFNRDDDGHDEQRNAGRPKQVSPVVFVAVERGDRKDHRRHHHGDAQGSCHIEAANERDQAKQVGEEDEEKHRHQERQEFVRLLRADVGHRHFITDEQHQGFQRICQPYGRLAWALGVRTRHAGEQHQHQRHHQQHAEDGFGDAQVVEARSSVVVVVVVPVIMVVAMDVRGVVPRNVPMAQRICDARWALREAGLAVAFKGAAHEHVQPVLLRVQNDGKRNVGVTPQVDFVRIRNVMDDEIARVERFSMPIMVVRVMITSLGGEQGGHHPKKECNALVHGCKSAAKVLTKAVFRTRKSVLFNLAC